MGFDPKTFTGPFLTFLSFAQTLLPLAMLEVYLRVQRGESTLARFAMAGAIGLVTFAMAFGIFVAANVLWLPTI